MIIAIVGSRDYESLWRVKDYVKNLASDSVTHTIMSGSADNVDTVAIHTARKYKLPVIVIKSEYDYINPKHAPLIRNIKIAQDADHVAVFWNGKSKGTLDLIKKAVIAGKTITINP